MLKLHFELGPRVKRPGVPRTARTGGRFLPFAGRTSTQIFMLSYLLLSMGALPLASRARLVPPSSSWCWWLGALLLAVAAWRIRTVGLTLVAAVVAAAMIRPAVWCLATKQRRALLAFAAAPVLIFGVVLARPWFCVASAGSASSSLSRPGPRGAADGLVALPGEFV